MKTHRFAALFGTLLLAATMSAADVAKGQTAYDAHCKSCHGATGAANPAVAKMMKVDIGDLGSAGVQAQSDAALIAVITDGKGKMKPVTMDGAAAANVVAYIRTLKK